MLSDRHSIARAPRRYVWHSAFVNAPCNSAGAHMSTSTDRSATSASKSVEDATALSTSTGTSVTAAEPELMSAAQWQRRRQQCRNDSSSTAATAAAAPKGTNSSGSAASAADGGGGGGGGGDWSVVAVGAGCRHAVIALRSA
jgi:hypothetical protein